MTSTPYLPKNADAVDWAGPESYPYAVSGLIHCVRLPAEADETDPVPVVVMIHGSGGNESVMWIFKQTLPPDIAVITPRALFGTDQDGFDWFYRDRPSLKPDRDMHSQALTALEHFVTSLPELYPIDPNRLVLIGFSQGAAMSNNLTMIRPDLVMGIASLAGFVPELPEAISAAASLSSLSVFIAHGTRDETVPVSAARRTREIYQQLGADITYGEYEVNHKMSSQGMKDLEAWVAKVMND